MYIYIYIYDTGVLPAANYFVSLSMFLGILADQCRGSRRNPKWPGGAQYSCAHHLPALGIAIRKGLGRTFGLTSFPKM